MLVTAWRMLPVLYELEREQRERMQTRGISVGEADTHLVLEYAAPRSTLNGQLQPRARIMMSPSVVLADGCGHLPHDATHELFKKLRAQNEGRLFAAQKEFDRRREMLEQQRKALK